MKVALSYGGCLSFSIAKKKDNIRYSEKIWDTLLTVECRNPNENSLKRFLLDTKEKIKPYIR